MKKLVAAITLIVLVTSARADQDFTRTPLADLITEHFIKDRMTPYQGPLRYPDFSYRDRKFRIYRTLIRESIRYRGVNFAGKYNVAQIGCGMGCTTTYVTDVTTGRVIQLPLGSDAEFRIQLYKVSNSPYMMAVWGGDSAPCFQEGFKMNENGTLTSLGGSRTPAMKDESCPGPVDDVYDCNGKVTAFTSEEDGMDPKGTKYVSIDGCSLKDEQKTTLAAYADSDVAKEILRTCPSGSSCYVQAVSEGDGIISWVFDLQKWIP
jgi:hypothetical protein